MKNIRIVLIILALLVLAAVTGKSQTGVDPGNPDTLYIDSVVAYTTGIGIIPVSFYNDEKLQNIEITLIHNSPDVKIDSFSFSGGRLDYLGNKSYAVYSDSSVIVIYALAIQEDYISTGKGLAGNLYLSFSPTITAQLVTFDTITYYTPQLIEHATTFKDTLPFPVLPFVPQVIKGYVDIQDTPATLDSVWVESIVTNPKKQIAVDVSLYNERNTKNVSVALDYGNDSLLHLDSVVFTGTRGDIANRNVQTNRSQHMLWVLLDFGEATPLATGTGPLFTLHLTVDSLISDTTLIIDSTTYFTEGNNTFIVLTSLDGNEKIKPIFNLGEIDIDIITAVEDITEDGQLPTSYTLSQNYPNPFNPSTEIEFSLPTAGWVTLDVFNILGQNVRRLVDQKLSTGVHRVTFDGRTDRNQTLASGIYLYRLTSGNFTQSRKMILLK
ncbi:MAG: T9SS type A sorting domain-containing protein [candidate division Zixibacteria bacterium]|nr:T9SS type A sorting domain-containing protein [candidate division Zixibacteria bacterium]